MADVGAHQGILAKSLAVPGRTVVATEWALGSFDVLSMALKSSPVEVRHGNGLEPLLALPLEAVVIAGMGYDTILSIMAMKDRLMSYPRFIVQPMQGGMRLHQAIVQNRWRIERAAIPVLRGRHYPTWLLDVYHESAEDDDGWHALIPTEFRGQEHYASWLFNELQYRRTMAPQGSRRGRQEIAWLEEEWVMARKRSES